MAARRTVRGRRGTLVAVLLLVTFATACEQAPAPSAALVRARTAGTRCPVGAAASAAVPGARVLLGTHLTLRAWRAPRRRELSRGACALGARIAREDLEWSRVQPRPDGPLTWGRTDGMFLSAAAQGLTLLPILDGTPRWAGPRAISMPTDPEDFARFAAAAVARYGPGGSLWRAHPRLARFAPHWWEIYNEPYKASPYPERYAVVVRAAARRMRAVDPHARILISGETNAVAGATGAEWVDRMYAAVPDFSRWFDALSVHPYDTGSPLDRSRDRAFRASRLEDLRAELVAHGDGDKHLWITEIGWSTCPDTECVSAAQQAAYTDQFRRLVETRWRPYVDAVIVYHLQNGSGADRESRYGLLRADGSRKPAWTVVRRWAGTYAAR